MVGIYNRGIRLILDSPNYLILQGREVSAGDKGGVDDLIGTRLATVAE